MSVGDMKIKILHVVFILLNTFSGKGRGATGYIPSTAKISSSLYSKSARRYNQTLDYYRLLQLQLFHLWDKLLYSDIIYVSAHILWANKKLLYIIFSWLLLYQRQLDNFSHVAFSVKSVNKFSSLPRTVGNYLLFVLSPAS